jgi:ribonucleoside-diphosphate reductase alpha chain
MADFINEAIENVWADRYRKNNESLDNNYHRVSKHCSKNEEEENNFYSVMKNREFFPAGRTMSNSGIGRDLTMNNCFTSPQVRDDLSDIFEKVKLGARTHQKGGGIGYDFSQLRPKGSPTSNDAIASGAVSFMDVFNAQTNTILQGNRRGANMGIMNVYSIDIEDFINAKSNDSKRLEHFNLSVAVDNDFIEAVKDNRTVYLHFPVYDENGTILKDESRWIYKKEVNAKSLWNLIIRKAYDNGEPGIFFYDSVNKDNNLWYIENIVTSNPCFEYLAGTVYGNNPITNEPINPADYGGACNLGSLLLHNFVLEPFTKNARVNYNRLKEVIYTAVRFLDNIIDINNFPDKIYKNYQESFRTIGLGDTGMADMLTMINLKYNSKEARDFIDKLKNFITFNAYMASIELAKEKGAFPFLDKDKFVKSGFIQKHLDKYPEWREVVDGIKRYGIRNAKMIAIAPTGTMSIVYGNNCSSGIEPIFSLEYDRKVRIGGQSEENIKIVKMQDYSYYLWKNTEKNNIVKEDVFVTALDMSVEDHLEMLKVVAFHADMSVSKTINIPTEYSFEDTKNVYMKVWEYGIKGCTIFRPNELRQGIINASKDKENIKSQLGRGDIISTSDDLIGFKKTIINGCGNFTLHDYFDESTGEPFETWISLGSKGGCERNLEFISRLISIALRSGVPIEEIIDQAKSIKPCKAYTDRTKTRNDTSRGTSCASAIGFALEEMNNKIHNYCFAEFDEEETSNSDSTIQYPCPDCGEELSYEGGCNVCKSCGWSKCS